MMLQMLYQWPEVKCRLWTYGPDLWTGKWLGSVLGFMLRVRVRVTVSIGVKIKVRVSSSILPYCRSAGLVHRSAFYPWPIPVCLQYRALLNSSVYSTGAPKGKILVLDRH